MNRTTSAGEFGAFLRPTPQLKRYVGAKLQTIWERSGMTQRDLCAEIFGTELLQAQWSKWVNGKTLPHLGTLDKIARWAGLPLDAFRPDADVPLLSTMDLETSLAELEQARALLTSPSPSEATEARQLLDRAVARLRGV